MTFIIIVSCISVLFTCLAVFDILDKNYDTFEDVQEDDDDV